VLSPSRSFSCHGHIPRPSLDKTAVLGPVTGTRLQTQRSEPATDIATDGWFADRILPWPGGCPLSSSPSCTSCNRTGSRGSHSGHSSPTALRLLCPPACAPRLRHPITSLVSTLLAEIAARGRGGWNGSHFLVLANPGKRARKRQPQQIASRRSSKIPADRRPGPSETLRAGGAVHSARILAPRKRHLLPRAVGQSRPHWRSGGNAIPLGAARPRKGSAMWVDLPDANKPPGSQQKKKKAIRRSAEPSPSGLLSSSSSSGNGGRSGGRAYLWWLHACNESGQFTPPSAAVRCNTPTDR
jgi:hypothetical protein